MDEKRKLFIGGGIAVLIAMFLAGFSIDFFKHKDKKFGEKIFNKVVNEKYITDVPERKTAKEYVPFDFNDIKKEIGLDIADEESKVIEIKNKYGEKIGTKKYKKNGEIVLTNLEKGKVTSIEFIEGEKDKKYFGKATLIYPDGVQQNYNYKSGIKEGEAEIIFTNGDREKYIYKKGIREGKATYYFANGDREEYLYINDVISGEAKYIYKNGKVENYNYFNGERG